MKSADIILSSYLNNENRSAYSSYSTDTVKELLARLGNPQNDFPSIHIAGTNGKGSTAYYTARIFTQAGYTTGLFVSPHLFTICERIQINGELISEKEFARCAGAAEAAADKMNTRPTFFDMVTAACFLCFRERGVDMAVIETGLGGRLDSTNSLNPLCSIITSVSLDHTMILGDTPGAIAAEKAGIIKPGVPLVTANTSSEVLGVLQKECAEKSAPFYGFGSEFRAENIRKDTGYIYDLDISNKYRLNDIRVNTPVYEQIENTACALTAVMLLRESYGRISAKQAAESISTFTPPGRFQLLCEKPLMIYDPAHNPSAVSSLMRAVTGRYGGKDITAVVTFMEDKDYSTMISEIKKTCGDIAYYYLDMPRAYKPKSFIGSTISSQDELVQYLEKKISADSLFLFTGSFRLFPAAKYAAEKLTEKKRI